MDVTPSSLENFVRHDVIDQQHQGVVAYTFEHPVGWQAESRVVWNYQHLHFPVVSFARVTNPGTPEAFEFLPSEIFLWQEPNYAGYQPGQNQWGTIHMPPMSGTEALVRLIVPKYRGTCQSVSIMDAGPVPNLVQKLNADEIKQPHLHQGAMARVEYLEQGRVVEEEFYVCHFQHPPLAGGGMAVYSWGLSRLFSFRAERGRLDALKDVLWKIASSVRFNPRWQQGAEQMIKQLAGQANQLSQNSVQAGWDSINAGWERLRVAGAQSRQFIANNQAYVDRQQERLQNDWHLRPLNTSSDNTSSGQSGEYTSHEAFVDTMREEESIYNPNAPHNEKVGGYHDYIWTDQTGNVQATDDPNYDPNTNSNHTWTLARKKRIGD
ncbi:MAG TPA: hypothetical protein VER08_09490 [Pyrinomonadaceae bacterium]|nr:hypothetical protein [Pyrinomonadaceae bacterium]